MGCLGQPPGRASILRRPFAQTEQVRIDPRDKTELSGSGDDAEAI